MSMKSILASELEKISLSPEEISRMNKVAKDFIASLKLGGVKAFVGGSLAKGTMVNREGKQDIDIFVQFDYSEDISGLEKILKKIKLPGVLKKVHGSRDYFQVVCDDLILEVIPVVKNSDPERAENVTDVSLSHVKYIGGEIRKNPAIADEIKLAKAFCQANRCYGAESYIHGFSGYSLEVLVIYFGGFEKFLKNIGARKGVPSKLGTKVPFSSGKKKVVDPLKYFKSEREVLSELNSSKLQGPLVLVDPTYKYRNVLAGLGSETFEKFLKIKDAFLKSPSLDFFELKPIDIEGMKKMSGRFVKVELKTDRQKGDIAGTKMKKLLDFFVRQLERKQQRVLAKEFDYDGGQDAQGYLVVIEKPEIESKGPSVGLEEASKAFLKAKGKVAFERKKSWWYKEKVSIESVFESVKKVEKEMGASGTLV